MRETPLILVVDDNDANVDILKTRLEAKSYDVITAKDGEEALARAYRDLPDLVLLDVMMPKIDGLEVCRRLKADTSLPSMPIILVTAKADSRDVVAGLEMGADDYLTKPIDQAALIARVRSILRAKALHDTVCEQSKRLNEQAEELAGWNRTLQEQVSSQVNEIERIGRLRRFLPHQLAELIISTGDEKVLESHRQEICVVFCDLRGFTAFSEITEPEEVMRVLGEYHATAGALIEAHDGTLERFLGDGLMVLFNDPVPCPDPAERGVRLALDLRAAIERCAMDWRQRGHDLGFGVGIAFGFATLGRIGFKGRTDYTAIGTVVNQAARLCGEAKAGEILITQRVATEVVDLVSVEALGELNLKGLRQQVTTYKLVQSNT